MPDTMRDALTPVLAAMFKPDSVPMGLIRHSLTAVGPLLVAHGVADGSTADAVVGALSVIVGVAWSWLGKYVVTHWLETASVGPTMTQPQLASVMANMPSGTPTAAKVAVAIQAVNDKGV